MPGPRGQGAVSTRLSRDRPPGKRSKKSRKAETRRRVREERKFTKGKLSTISVRYLPKEGQGIKLDTIRVEKTIPLVNLSTEEERRYEVPKQNSRILGNLNSGVLYQRLYGGYVRSYSQEEDSDC